MKKEMKMYCAHYFLEVLMNAHTCSLLLFTQTNGMLYKCKEISLRHRESEKYIVASHYYHLMLTVRRRGESGIIKLNELRETTHK